MNRSKNDIESLIRTLKGRLQQPLPGWSAQQKMATQNHRTARLQPHPSARQAGVLILLYPDDQGQVCFPLIQRPTYEGVHSGQIAFPGGKVEVQDQDIVDTALRETREEIGVSVDRTEVLGKLTDLYIPVSRIVVTPVVAYVDQPPAYLLDPLEVADTLDVSLAEFLDNQNQSVQSLNVRGYTLDAPCYLIQSKVIWGATAMMLAEFFALVQEIS